MPKKNIPSTSLHIDIRNVKGEAIPGAKVTLQPTDSKAKAIPLEYDDRSETYVAEEVSSGNYVVKVSHGKF